MLQSDYKFGEVFKLVDQTEPNDEKVQFKRVFGNSNGGVTFVAFKAGQELTTHTAPAEVMICVAEGEIEFTMLGTPHILRPGEFMLMGADVPHSVKALADSKMMLIKVKP